MIELAIIAPLLLVGTLCAADLGRFALQKTWVTYAASAGAEYAVAHGFSASAITTAATSAAPVSGISASPAPSEYYGCATATGVTVSTNGATCPSGTSTGGTAGQYVSVTTTMPFTALFSAAGISYPSSLAATAVVRIQ
jgi:Flp pilus assembly protein TadG